ncbi:SANT/Myb domain [Macleaya cordata]|uniref:SANT/Myb domain n=1 Tax=Macleaya cordata TaxID=56857 RepID=A0A200R6Q3_MACCD|nr:SANT/Myb domain [Macleaya cordata]
MMMDAGKAITPPPSSSDHLPWLWVIESLSDSKLVVDPSLLHDLISKASELTTDDSFIENVRERLALNQLEDLLCGPSTSKSTAAAVADAIPSNATLNSESHSKVGIDVSDRAQDVLRLLHDNMETSNMRISMLDSLKWDVHQFILHKRAGLPKCDLRQLKSAILEGVDPSASLLREMAGLGKEDQLVKIPVDVDVPNAAILEADNSSAEIFRQRSRLEKVDQQDHRIPVNVGDPNTAAGKCDENMNDLEIQSSKEHSCHLGPENGNQLLLEDSCGKDLISMRKESPEQNHNQCLGECRMGLDTVNNAAEGLEQSLKYDEVHSKNQNSVPLAPENMKEIVQETPPDSSLISSKKERSCFSKKELVHCVGKGTFCGERGDQQPGPKDLNNNVELKSLRQNSTSLHGNEPVQDPSGRNLSSVDKEVSDSAKGIRVHDLQGDGNLVHDGDGFECVSLKRLKQGINDCQIQHNLSHCPSSDGVIPEEAHLDGHHQNNYINESKVDSESRTKPGTSSSYDRNLDKAPTFDSDEEMVIAAEKHSFLSSQSTFNQDSQATAGWTEGSICIKCNEGGQLLTCCVSSCPLAVHESCVGSSFSVSDSGKFYCPFCSYVQAIASHRETKKKAALVKKKVALARNHLSEFMCMVNAQRQQQPSELAPSEELINSRMVEDTNFLNDIHGSRLQREIINNQPMQAAVSQQEAEVALECINSLPSRGDAPKSPLSDRNAAKARGEVHWKQVIGHKNQRLVEDEELAEPCTAHHSDDLPQRVEETTLNCENTLNVLLSEEREKAEMNEDQPYVSEESKHVKAHRKGKTVKSSCRYAETASIHQEHADVEKEIEDWQYTADPHQGPSCQRNVNADKVAENQNDDGISSGSRRRARVATQHSNWERRKKTAWSAEEEEILKEGVFRFASHDGKTVPWKKIREFGSHVFLKSRTTIDLKDKWRNIWSKGGGRRG